MAPHAFPNPLVHGRAAAVPPPRAGAGAAAPPAPVFDVTHAGIAGLMRREEAQRQQTSQALENAFADMCDRHVPRPRRALTCLSSGPRERAIQPLNTHLLHLPHPTGDLSLR